MKTTFSMLILVCIMFSLHQITLQFLLAYSQLIPSNTRSNIKKINLNPQVNASALYLISKLQGRSFLTYVGTITKRRYMPFKSARNSLISPSEIIQNYSSFLARWWQALKKILFPLKKSSLNYKSSFKILLNLPSWNNSGSSKGSFRCKIQYFWY